MDPLACEGQRNVELPTVDWLTAIARLNRRYMTNAATVLSGHRFKQIPAQRYIGGKPGIVLDVCILRRRLRSAHELCEYVDIRLFIFAADGARIVYARLIVAHLIEAGAESDEATKRSIFGKYQAIGDAD